MQKPVSGNTHKYIFAYWAENHIDINIKHVDIAYQLKVHLESHRVVFQQHVRSW